MVAGPRNHLQISGTTAVVPTSQNHWIAVVSGLRFCKETSFALSVSCLLIAGGRIRALLSLSLRTEFQVDSLMGKLSRLAD